MTFLLTCLVQHGFDLPSLCSLCLMPADCVLAFRVVGGMVHLCAELQIQKHSQTIPVVELCM